MKITVDGQLLADAVKTLRSVTLGTTVQLEVVPNFLKLTCVNGSQSLMTTVPTKLVEKSKYRECALDLDAFATASTKLKGVTLSFTDSSVTIISGRYKAELIAHQFEKQQVIPESEKTKGIRIKPKFIDALSKLIPKLELSPLLPTYDYVPFGIKVSKEGTFIASYDFYQAAFVQVSELTGDFSFVLPSNIFATLTKELKGQDYNLIVTESSVYAYNDNFEFAATIPQVEGTSTVSFEEMQELHKQLKSVIKKDGVSIKLSTEAITQLLGNGRAVYEKDASFEFDIRGDKCKLELKSSSGRISCVLILDEKTTDVKFSCDFHFFSSLMKKAGSKLNLLLIPDRMLLFRNSPITYMMSLS